MLCDLRYYSTYSKKLVILDTTKLFQDLHMKQGRCQQLYQNGNSEYSEAHLLSKSKYI